MPKEAIRTYEQSITTNFSPAIISTMRVVVETCYKEILKTINKNKYDEIYSDFKIGSSDPIGYSKKARNAVEIEIGSRCFTSVFNLLGNSNHKSMTKEEGDLLLSVFDNEWKEITFYVKKYLGITIPYHEIESINNNSFFNEYYDEIIKSIYQNPNGRAINKNRIYYFVEEVKVLMDKKGNIIFENIARAWYQKRGNKSTKITFYSKEKLVASNCYTAEIISVELDKKSGIKFLFAKEIKYKIRGNLLKNIEQVCKIKSMNGSEFDNLMNYLFDNSISLFNFLSLDEKDIIEKYNMFIENKNKNVKKIINSLIYMHHYMKANSHARLLIFSLDDEIHNRMMYENLNDYERYDEFTGVGKKEYFRSNILHTGICPFDNDPIMFDPYKTKLPLEVKIEMVTNVGWQSNLNFRLSVIYFAIKSVAKDFNNELITINDESLKKINVKIAKYVKIIDDLDELKDLVKRINKETKLAEAFYEKSRIHIDENTFIIKKDITNNLNIYNAFTEMQKNHNYKIDVESAIAEYKNDMNNIEENIDDKKIEALKMLEKSRLLIINGSAGTGKSLLLKYVSKLYNSEEFNIYAIAQTNAAKENLDLIVPEFVKTSTTTKFINDSDYNEIGKNIIILDEAGVISNEMFKKIISLKPEVLILAGDHYQLPSINIGNWFETLCELPLNNKIQLSNNYRSNDSSGKLNSQWEAFRNRKTDKFVSLLQKDNFLTFQKGVKPFEFLTELANKTETSIVSLSYSGILGVNNCNYLIQLLNNPEKDLVRINGLEFKEGDKVLFDTNSPSDSYFYNNLKGKIIKIKETETEMFFYIETVRSNEVHVFNCIIGWVTPVKCEKIEKGYKVQLLIKIDKYDSKNEEGNFRPPFHISYSNSIHKSQGLEYKTILIITSPNMEDMDFNILYTAITRAKENFILLTNPENFNENIIRIFEENPKTDNILKKIILSKGKCIERYSEA